MSAGASRGLLSWAELLGEALGRKIAHQLRSKVAGRTARVAVRKAKPAATRVARASVASAPKRGPGRPPKAAATPRAERPRGPRVIESVKRFGPGATVEFNIGRRVVTGSVLTSDESAGELSLLDLKTQLVVQRRPSQVRLIKAAPVLFQIRRKADAAAASPSEPEAQQPSWATEEPGTERAPAKTYSESRSAAEALFARRVVEAVASDAAEAHEDSERSEPTAAPPEDSAAGEEAEGPAEIAAAESTQSEAAAEAEPTADAEPESVASIEDEVEPVAS